MSESLSSGKASGKTITLTAYLDWFEDATGINDSDPKEWHELRERIAELEAELAGARSALEMALSEKNFHRRNAEKAEAEVERLRRLLARTLAVIVDETREDKTLAYELKDYFGGLDKLIQATYDVGKRESGPKRRLIEFRRRAAANPAALTLAQSAHRATTRHDFPNGGALGHWLDRPCREYCLAARKERDG